MAPSLEAGSLAPSASSFRAPKYLGDQYLAWWGGLLAALLASGLSYYTTSLYADLQTALRRRRYDPARSVARADGGGGAERTAAEAGAGVRVRARIVATLALCFTLFVTLDLISLAVLPLTLVVPVIMLFFVWGTLYQFAVSRSRRAFVRTKEFVLGGLVVLLISIAVAASPKGLYMVFIPDLVKWDAKSVTYTAAFLLGAMLLYALRWSRSAAARAFCCCATLGARDVQTVVRALLAGILGGQALVLLKLVAEIIQNVVTEGQPFFQGTSVVVVCVMCALTQAAHIYSYSFVLSNLDDENVRLMVPVHRFALMMSALVGAAVYLEEWLDEEVTAQDSVIYSLAMSGLLGFCIVYAHDAVAVGADSKVRDEQVQDAGAPAPDEHHAAPNGDIEMQQCLNPSRETDSAGKLGVGAGARATRLWDLGAGSCDDDSDDSAGSDSFFLAVSGSRADGASSPNFRFFRRRGSSAGKAGSAGPPLISLGGGGGGGESKNSNNTLVYSYPPVRNTMMTHRSARNPHTGDVPDESRWEDPGALRGQWQVRGSNYLADGLKIDADPTAMQVAGMQWSYSPDPIACVAREPGGFVATEQHLRPERPFMFIVNFMVPSLGNYAVYFVAREGHLEPGFAAMLEEFCNHASDEYRNDRFKLIPGVKEGSFFVRKAVGAKPALLCQKLATAYHSSWDRAEQRVSVLAGGGHWFEVAIDVGSSAIARSIMGAVKGYASGLVLHLGYLLESKTEQELPERMLGGIDLYRPCMKPKAGVPLLLPLVAKPPQQPVQPPVQPALLLLQTPAHPPSMGFDMLPAPPSPGAVEAMRRAGALRDDSEDEYEDEERRSVDAGGYETDDSFKSVMDDPEEQEPARSARAGSVPQAALQPGRALDDRYPVPDNTMVVPRGAPNPHAEPGRSSWVDAGLEPGGWKVRGPTYDHDGIKIPCGVARMKIVAMDWNYSPVAPVRHMAALGGGFVDRHHRGRNDRPFLLIVNFLVPSVGGFVTYLARNNDVPDAVFDEMLADFINAPSDEYRNDRFKLIPGVNEGSFFVRKAVGQKPALLCQKLTTTYHRGDNYLEVVIDVGSSSIGATIFASVKGFASSLCLHLGVVLESKTRRELPEQLLFGIDISTPVMEPRKTTSFRGEGLY